MRGASRASLAEATDRLTGMLAGGADAGQLGDELFSVTELLDGESGLRRVLSDPSRPAAASQRNSLAPAGIGTPPSVTDWVVTRRQTGTDGS